MNHFDEIENYDEEIPAHIASYLLEVKVIKIQCLLKKYFESDKRKDDNLKGLDLGCGTGGYIDYLQHLDHSLIIDGLDFSRKQLDHAQAKGFTNNFIHSSMSNIDSITDETYNFVYAINSLHHLPGKEEQTETLAEIFRILVPGGLFIIHEINIKNPLVRFYVNYIFPKIREIDDGSEIWLSEKLVKKSKFSIEEIECFTFVPDFTPRFLMGAMAKLDKFLSKSFLSLFGAHIMFVLRKQTAR